MTIEMALILLLWPFAAVGYIWYICSVTKPQNEAQTDSDVITL